MMGLEKIEANPYGDLYWNIPEMKQGRVNVIGGNGQSFRTPVKTAEYLAAKYPVKAVNVVLPDALQGRVPAVEGVVFAPSTEVGSFADSEVLGAALYGGDFNILVGDLSRNSVTLKVVAQAVAGSIRPLLITRDAVEAALGSHPERVLMRENLIWLVSLPQLQKMLRAVYYPKVLTLTQPLVMTAEILHKFTLSYPCKIVTLVDGQILVIENGRVVAVPLEKSGFSPLTIWGGELAARIAALNLYNPGKFIEATVAGILQG